MSSSPRSVRFESSVLHRLVEYVHSHSGASISSVTSMFVDEALRTEEHPGITFRPGPTGRRAGLVAGPDIWEVISTLHNVQDASPELVGDALVTEVGEALGLSEHKVRIAIRYYGAYPADIDWRIKANNEATIRLETAWRAEQQILRRKQAA
jgi:hypothetical protein